MVGKKSKNVRNLADEVEKLEKLFFVCMVSDIRNKVVKRHNCREDFGYALYVPIAKDASFCNLEMPFLKGSLLVSYGFVVFAFFL